MGRHIDRAVWEPCRVCGQYKVLGFRGWRRQENMLKPPDGSGGCMYCPHCGRPRNEKAWAKLEHRLRWRWSVNRNRAKLLLILLLSCVMAVFSVMNRMIWMER